jgi:hypothetical protein
MTEPFPVGRLSERHAFRQRSRGSVAVVVHRISVPADV